MIKLLKKKSFGYRKFKKIVTHSSESTKIKTVSNFEHEPWVNTFFDKMSKLEAKTKKIFFRKDFTRIYEW